MPGGPPISYRNTHEVISLSLSFIFHFTLHSTHSWSLRTINMHLHISALCNLITL
jgi:hypothetical protein